MARVLIVYHWEPTWAMRATYESHLRSLERYSEHTCFYLNTAAPRVPGYLRRLDPDLVVFHNLFALRRYEPATFERMKRAVDFVKDLPARKVLLSSDEAAFSDSLVAFINEFEISQVFTFAGPAAQAMIYDGVDRDRVEFHLVQSAYVDDLAVRRVSELSESRVARTIDIGGRLTVSPTAGSFGQLRQDLVEAFAERGPGFGHVVDISKRIEDTLYGDDWFNFLLRCRWTFGVETGASLLDRDGSVFGCVIQYMAEHQNATYADVEATCFAGLDGGFDYRALAPRHLEAVMTRTGQVLMTGEYGGILKAGQHYLELARDMSNLDEVLDLMQDEELRTTMTERAYADIIASGRYSYGRFAEQVFGEALRGAASVKRPGSAAVRLLLNRLGERWFFSGWRAAWQRTP